MVKADSRPLSYCLVFFLFDVFIGVPWILGGFRAPVWVSLLLVGLVLVEIVTVQGVIREEARRQTAVLTPDEYWLVRPAPSFAQASNLPPAYTVVQRPGWHVYAGVPIFAFLGAEAWLNLFWPDHASSSLFLEVCMGLTLVCSLWVILFEFQQVKADEEGLTVRTPYRRQRLRWQEAQLFAIATDAAGTIDPPSDYELSSATQMVRWRRKSRSLPLSRGGPVVQGEMDVILPIIHAQTGLPFLDLRRPLPQATFSPDSRHSQPRQGPTT